MGLEASQFNVSTLPTETRDAFRAISQWPRNRVVKAVHRLKEYPYHMLVDSITLMELLDCDRKMAQDLIDFFAHNKKSNHANGLVCFIAVVLIMNSESRDSVGRTHMVFDICDGQSQQMMTKEELIVTFECVNSVYALAMSKNRIPLDTIFTFVENVYELSKKEHNRKISVHEFVEWVTITLFNKGYQTAADIFEFMREEMVLRIRSASSVSLESDEGDAFAPVRGPPPARSKKTLTHPS